MLACAEVHDSNSYRVSIGTVGVEGIVREVTLFAFKQGIAAPLVLLIYAVTRASLDQFIQSNYH